MQFNQLIAKRIRLLLKEYGWTCYQLSSRSAIACSTLSCVINCKCKTVMAETLLNICRGFNITLQEFFNDVMFSFENIADND